MAASLKQTHKVSKGETLERIAKKYGHKDWKAIWKAPENKAIASKRREPENIAPGDVLVIPPNEKQVKENAEELLALNRARDADVKLRAALTNEVGRLEKSVKIYDDLIKGSREATDQLVVELQSNLRSMKNWATGVDAVATLINMGRSLGKIVGVSRKAVKACGEELVKLNEEALKEAVKLPQDQIQDATVKGIASMKDKTSRPLAYVGILADSWDKMTSPSFWANTYVQMTDNGKSWSQAVTMDIGEDIEERIKTVERDGANNVKRLQAEQSARKAKLAETRKLIKDCEARIKDTEKKADELPQC